MSRIKFLSAILCSTCYSGYATGLYLDGGSGIFGDNAKLSQNLFLGYSFTQNIAIELGVDHQIALHDKDYNNNDPYNNFDNKLSNHFLTLPTDLRFDIPLHQKQKFWLILKTGTAYYYDLQTYDSQTPIKFDINNVLFFNGVGIKYSSNDQLDVSLQWQHMLNADREILIGTLGLAYHFK